MAKAPKTAKPRKKAARKNAEAEADRPDTAKISEARMTPASDLEKLMRRAMASNKQTSEINGTLGEMIKNAVENKNLDRVAFNWAKAMVKKKDDPGKVQTTLACFDYYRKVFNLDDIADTQGSLDIARQEAGEEEPGHPAQAIDPVTETGDALSNVSQLRPVGMA